MKFTINLSKEQVKQLIHYDETKSITTACNFTTSVVEYVKRMDMFDELKGAIKFLEKDDGR